MALKIIIVKHRYDCGSFLYYQVCNVLASTKDGLMALRKFGLVKKIIPLMLSIFSVAAFSFAAVFVSIGNASTGTMSLLVLAASS